jgi:Domain of unknown function (DU1801)
VGKPCYTVGGRNVVIIQSFKGCCALGFFQGALLKGSKRLLVQLGQMQTFRVMKFSSVNDVTTKKATIKVYVREAIAARKAGENPAARVSRAGRAKRQIPQRYLSQARFRGPDTWPSKGVSVLLRGREAIFDADRTYRTGNASDFRRSRSPGTAIDRARLNY